MRLEKGWTDVLEFGLKILDANNSWNPGNQITELFLMMQSKDSLNFHAYWNCLHPQTWFNLLAFLQTFSSKTNFSSKKSKQHKSFFGKKSIKIY